MKNIKWLEKINYTDEPFANNFAKNKLINKQDYESFIKYKHLTLNNLRVFAESQDIPLFILMGRR